MSLVKALIQILWYSSVYQTWYLMTKKFINRRNHLAQSKLEQMMCCWDHHSRIKRHLCPISWCSILINRTHQHHRMKKILTECFRAKTSMVEIRMHQTQKFNCRESHLKIKCQAMYKSTKNYWIMRKVREIKIETNYQTLTIIQEMASIILTTKWTQKRRCVHLKGMLQTSTKRLNLKKWSPININPSCRSATTTIA